MYTIEKFFPDIEQCIENFCIQFETTPSQPDAELLYTQAVNEHKKRFLSLLQTTDPEQIEIKTDDLIRFTIDFDIPFMFIYGELVSVARKLLGNLIEEGDFENIKALNSYFATHEERIISGYLKRYLHHIELKYIVRLSHIDSLEDKKLMQYYEHHLHWMINLIHYIQKCEYDDCYPELRHTHCEFGKWLHNTTIPYLITTEHFKVVEKLHINLHDLAKNIIFNCQCGNCNPSAIIHLLQRIDYISLEIGNEIAILNEIEESSKDPLTAVLTRRLFDKVMKGQLALAKTTHTDVGLLMCDLDHFKSINDTYGHLTGDAVLQHFATLLNKHLRKSDYIFRFGGEEFVILLPATNAEDTIKLAQKLCDATASEKFTVGDISIHYTVSIGVLPIHITINDPIHQESVNHYLDQVDQKLYQAKKNGRNRIA